MAVNVDEVNQLWGEFLDLWPLERIKSMSLHEYSNVGNEDTFTYWIGSAKWWDKACS